MFGFIFLILGTINLGFAGLCLYVWFLFTRLPDSAAKTSARLQATKHKRDVWIYGKKNPGSSWQQVAFAKHITKAKYSYVVAGKEYVIRDDYIGTPRQTPMFVSVKYWKRFPRFACIDTDVSVKEFTFVCSCFCWLGPAVAMLLCGIMLLTM